MRNINTYIIEKFKISKNTKSEELSNTLSEILLPNTIVKKHSINTYDDFVKCISDWLKDNDIDESDSLFDYNITMYTKGGDAETLKYVISNEDFIKKITVSKEKVSFYDNLLRASENQVYIFHENPTHYISIFTDKNKLMYVYALGLDFFKLVIIKNEYGALG